MPVDMLHWKNLIKQRAESIADESYQRYEWFENSENTWFFPEEMFCKFFDDAAAEEYFSRTDNGLNQQQNISGKYLVKLMHQLSKQVRRPPTGIDPSQLIDDPLMAKCREAANKFLILLD